MGWVIRFLDHIGDWIAEHCPPRAQRRIGVAMMLVSIPLFVYAPFSGEPFLIYEMSVGALAFGGLTTIVAALPSE
jgi:hypothetical protein